ncbi:[protein-PII] uridylyltransferase [Acidisoma cellulosilytica]|uniref:Bifunctional uridylyltransferase/uridylyl-removing enzyme n=1 Tax=Acidisoma cellulosilyticum TaxID=2802395 RepID=A0A963YY79_9PROT|nr:[protein-PII] uridylyltransferase [Acidisoma cellulosilyticum]MCB8879026.1 [protein-PII] uridylyltransferase [Acidisoma cellulosilyticum]
MSIDNTVSSSTLTDALSEIAAADGSISREAALAAFRRHLSRTQHQLQLAFERDELSGLTAAAALANHMDAVVIALMDYTGSVARPNAPDRMTVVATGGYGRGYLAPFSDIDLLFLTEADPSEETLASVEFMLYFLWDLGLKVGHATRSVEECLTEARSDATVRTTLLDARCLVGEMPLFEEFRRRFRAQCVELGAAEFIRVKQAERAARHRRYGDSPFLVEPNVKEGRGAMRDLHYLHWVANYVYDIADVDDLLSIDGPYGPMLTLREARHFRRAQDFLWTVRFHLHYVAGRPEERLTFDLQPIVGARMGYTRHGVQDGVERFMRHYFLTARDVARLTHVLEPELVRVARGSPAVVAPTDQILLQAGVILADGQLLCTDIDAAAKTPIIMLKIMQFARDRHLRIHPLALRSMIRNERTTIQLRRDPQAMAIFMDLLCGKDGETGRSDGARWLSLMNETGILSRLVPDWARIVGQMQFDTYHVFTVDEHTIEALRVVASLERGELTEAAPVASSLVDHLQSRRALYTAVLLHDIAKGRGGDHSVLGAEIALNICPMLGLSAEETEMVSWLVLHHLLLSQTAFKRDIDDPKTILDLVDTVQSPERLKLLLVLTVADMRAVSPKVWNGWKATLLRELYTRVAEVLAGGLATTERDVRVARAKEAAAERLSDWTAEDIASFLDLGYPAYWLSFDPATHERHGRVIRDASHRQAPLSVQHEVLHNRAVTEVTVYAADHAGLFSRIAGALAIAGASIVDARIHTLTNGMALDTFWIQDANGGIFASPQRLARLSVLIEQALAGSLRMENEIRGLSDALLGQRMRAIHVPPRVVIDNHASNTHTVVEVNGRDRPGLLHDVTAAITGQGMQIASAHVSTYGVRAIDVFYIKDVFGLKVQNERKLENLRHAILRALASGDTSAPTEPDAESFARSRPKVDAA